VHCTILTVLWALLLRIPEHGPTKASDIGRFRCHNKFSLAKRLHLAIMSGQLDKERAVFLQRVFDMPAALSAIGCVSS